MNFALILMKRKMNFISLVRFTLDDSYSDRFYAKG